MKYLSIDINRLEQSDTWLKAHQDPWIALAAVNLWMVAAKRNGEGIPDDDFALAKYAGVTPEIWSKIRSQVLSSWHSRHKRFYHPVVSAEVERFEKAVEHGRLGGQIKQKNKELATNPSRVSDSDPTSPPSRVKVSDPSSTLLPKSCLVKENSTPQTPLQPKSQPETALAAAETIFDRAVRVLKIDLKSIRKHTGWSNLPAAVNGWVEAGCDPDLDVWPTIEKLGLAKIASGGLPGSPAYFNTAVLESRDRRRVDKSPGSAHTGIEISDSPFEWSDRLSVLRRGKGWSKKWGPEPGQEGCLCPQWLIDDPQGHIHPEYRSPPEPKWERLPDGSHTWPLINGK